MFETRLPKDLHIYFISKVITQLIVWRQVCWSKRVIEAFLLVKVFLQTQRRSSTMVFSSQIALFQQTIWPNRKLARGIHNCLAIRKYKCMGRHSWNPCQTIPQDIPSPRQNCNPLSRNDLLANSNEIWLQQRRSLLGSDSSPVSTWRLQYLHRRWNYRSRYELAFRQRR